MSFRIVIVAGVIISLYLMSCKGPEGPSGPPGISGIASLTDPSIQPHVIFTRPLANSQGPYTDFTGQFSVRFNKIMDRSSIRRSLSLSAPHGNVTIDSNSVRTSGGDVFTFPAVDSAKTRSYSTGYWRVAELYTLNISSEAKDVNGNLLQPPFSMTFTPEPTLRSLYVYPPDGSNNISVGFGMSMDFNSPLVPSALSSIHITPSLLGAWIFISYSDSTYISYSFANSFELDTTYTITIDTTFHDKYGNHLPQQFSSHFRTEPFRIQSTYPSDGDSVIDRSQQMYVYLNAPIDTATVSPAFSVSPPVAGVLEQGYHSFTFRPNNIYQPNTRYNVTLSTDLSSSSGKHLPEPYVFSFTTGN